MAETMAAAANGSSSSASSRNNNQPTIYQLNVTGIVYCCVQSQVKTLEKYFPCISVLRATIDPSLILKKPSPYVEISVDGKFVRKTESVKNSHEPSWSSEIHTL